MERWRKQLAMARQCILDSQDLLSKSAKSLAKKLGFKHYDLFSAVFCGQGHTAIVTFGDEGIGLELDIEEMEGMTKKQVIEGFIMELPVNSPLIDKLN